MRSSMAKKEEKQIVKTGILAVDDNPTALRLLESMLGARGL